MPFAEQGDSPGGRRADPAWLWVGTEWVSVQVLRTSPHSPIAVVRMEGGRMASVTASMLRPRVHGEGPPSPPSPRSRRVASPETDVRGPSPRESRQSYRSPRGSRESYRGPSPRGPSPGPEGARRREKSEPASPRRRASSPPQPRERANSEQRPDAERSSAGKPPPAPRRAASAEGARRSADGPGPGRPTAGGGTPRNDSKEPPSGAPSGRPPRPSVHSAAPEDESVEAQWAKARLAKLYEELKCLDKRTSAERRTALRNLQRELHPDKHPPELRPHVAPLFHIVRREWEADESQRARAASKDASPRPQST